MRYIAPPSSLKPGAVAWVYVRDSGGENQERSTQQQTNEIRNYCSTHHLNLERVFEDAARSGGTTVGRDAFLEMIDTAERTKHRPDIVLLWNFARFARDLDTSSFYKAKLRNLGIVVHSITDPIPDGPYGRLVETVIDIANEEKRRQNKVDVQRALQTNTKQGYSCGGFPPRGYLAQPEQIGTRRNGKPRIVSRWIPDPALVEDVRTAFQMRAEGKSYDEIMSATGGRIYKNRHSWITFFKNKTYIGVGKCGELEVENHHPAIIDLETWQAVQVVQAASLTHHGEQNPRHKAHPSLLVGIARCAKCGGRIVKERSRNYDYYCCNEHKVKKVCDAPSVSMQKVDSIVLETVFNRVLTVEFMQELLTQLKTELSQSNNYAREEEHLIKSLAKINRSITNLIELGERTGADSVAERLIQREAERAHLQSELRTLNIKRQTAQLAFSDENLESIIQASKANALAAKLKGDIFALRNLLKRCLTRVELGKDQITLYYTFPMDNQSSLFDTIVNSREGTSQPYK